MPGLIGEIDPYTAFIGKIGHITTYIEYTGPIFVSNLETGDPQKKPRAHPIHNQADTSTLLGIIGKIVPITAFKGKIGPITPYKEYIGPI